MTRSWNHRVHELTLEAAAQLGDQEEDRTCRATGCGGPVTHEASYAYVTGRAARTATARRLYCLLHARRFADRHGLLIGGPAPLAPHPLDTLADQLCRSFGLDARPTAGDR